MIVVHIYYPDLFSESVTEFHTFDTFSLVNELGGLSGLFLGLSFYNVAAWAVEAAEAMRTKFWDGQTKKRVCLVGRVE